MFSIDGIVSGFDTSTIIESLLGFQQAQVDTFNSRKAEIATEQSAFKGIEAQLLSLQTSLGRLNRNSSSVFDAKVATSSNEDILTVAADGGATNGTYQLTVESLAAAHQIGSQGYGTTADQVGTGEISISVGNGAATTITIDNSNNTVSGLVGAINDQVDDVTASVVFDQGADAYRILLSANQTGADNQIAIASTLAGGTAPDFSGDPIQAAANAVIKLGSGVGAISAEYSSNKIDGLIENVTLDLKSASAGTTVSVEVNSNTESAREAIEGFVEDFNALIEFIDNQTRFDPENNIASPLLGNRSVNDLKSRLLSVVSETIDTGTSLRRLAQIGVDLNSSGRLTIDSTKLENALSGELEGVDAGDIRFLFGLNATSNNSGVRFILGGPRSQESSTPYQIDITQAAEQATITATNALAASVLIDDSNNTLQISVDGVNSEVLTLANGTYTREELASQLEGTINGSDELGIHNVTVSISASNELVITSEAYGSAARVSSVAGSVATTLGFTGTESGNGQDVVGSFIVDGQTEVATGTGRLLRGHPDNANTADLQFEVTLTSDRVVAGVDAEVGVFRGVTGRLNRYMNSLLDAENGLVKNVNEEFNSRIDSIDQSIQRVEDLTEAKREFLIREFTALESILSQLQNTGDIISSQLSTLSAFRNNNNNRS